MSKNILNFILVSVLFVFIGCGKNNVIKQNNVKKVDLNKLPPWVKNPNYDNNIGVVSIIPKKKIKNKNKLYKIAKLKAIAEFQTRKGAMVNSNTKITSKNGINTGYSENIKISSSHIQTNNLVVKDTYEDEDNFYMWMVIKN